jgi:Zn-dependent peptidase ImmA (M78 family)/transcriptional regulator with XRE-family HTH domain
MPAEREVARSVGARIRTLRTQEGLTQEQLAHLLNRRQATISAWESGRTMPSLGDLYDMAYLLDRDVYELLPRRRSEPPSRGLMRAIEAQLPVGGRTRAALELFIRDSSAGPVPTRQLVVAGEDPIAVATKAIAAAGIETPPVDVAGVARRCGCVVASSEGMDEAISGLLVGLPDGHLIATNGRHPVERQRFSMAHELGHLLLGHLQQFHVDLSGREEGPGYDRLQERAANSFAANLLMPEPWVRAAAEGADVIEDLAARFHVSELAMGYRLMALGLKMEAP